MSELAPPNQIRSGPPPGPTRDVKRSARLRDHESDGQARRVTGRYHHEHDGQDFEEPAVVISHPAAAVSEGQQMTGHVVELTPRNQPVLQAGHLRLLLDAELPFAVNSEVALTVTRAEPAAMGRIDTVNGEAFAGGALMPLMVLALSDGEAANPAPSPAGYAASPAMLRARAKQGHGGQEW